MPNEHWTTKVDWGGADPKPFMKYDSIEKAVVGSLGAHSKIGELNNQLGRFKDIDPDNVVSFPGKDATPEQVRDFRMSVLQRTGSPKELDAYKDLKTPDGSNGEEIQAFKERMLALGATPEQAQQHLDKAIELRADLTRRARRGIIESASKRLKGDFADEYKPMMDFAKKAISEWGLDEAGDIKNLLFDENDNPKNAAILSLLARIGKDAFGEAGFIETARGITAKQRADQEKYRKRFPNTPVD